MIYEDSRLYCFNQWTLKPYKNRISSTSTHLKIPLAFEDRITEMYKTYEILFVDRSDIQDIVFIIPVAEVESGVFHLSGADNVFCTQFVKENQYMRCSLPSLYFSRYIVEPFSIRLFMALNTLALHLRRSMYHQAESALRKRTFHLPLFPMESFWYLIY